MFASFRALESLEVELDWYIHDPDGKETPLGIAIPPSLKHLTLVDQTDVHKESGRFRSLLLRLWTQMPACFGRLRTFSIEISPSSNLESLVRDVCICLETRKFSPIRNRPLNDKDSVENIVEIPVPKTSICHDWKVVCCRWK